MSASLHAAVQVSIKSTCKPIFFFFFFFFLAEWVFLEAAQCQCVYFILVIMQGTKSRVSVFL